MHITHRSTRMAEETSHPEHLPNLYVHIQQRDTCAKFITQASSRNGSECRGNTTWQKAKKKGKDGRGKEKGALKDVWDLEEKEND